MKESLVDRASVERLLLVVGALRSGIVDALAGADARSAAEIAHGAEADPRATAIVLEALVAEGLVDRTPPGTTRGPGEPRIAGEAVPTAEYRLSARGRAHLVDPGPDLERHGLLHQVNKMRGWLELPEVIRTGEPLPRDPAKRDLRTMAGAMGERDPAILDEILERCLAYAGPIRTMLDVGGAVGHVARRFSDCGVRATLLDREGVLVQAEDYLGDAAADIALIPGDYTEMLPPGPFDLVYFGNVYHIYGPATNTRVTREAFSIVSPGGVIAIQDHVWGRGRRGALFAVNMLQATVDGGVWSEPLFRNWLHDAGFGEVQVVDLESAGSQLVLGRRPRTSGL